MTRVESRVKYSSPAEQTTFDPESHVTFSAEYRLGASITQAFPLRVGSN
jgi:hypothetical protein